MYSYEIDQTIKYRDYNIDSKTYLHICQSSPQISRVKYEPFDDNFNIWTDDNYHWTFRVRLRGEE